MVELLNLAVGWAHGAAHRPHEVPIYFLLRRGLRAARIL
jgi:hypothetical protein